MRRVGVILICILTAVLFFSTAFADSDVMTVPTDSESEFLEEIREAIVPPFEETGLSNQHYRNYPQLIALYDRLQKLSSRIENNGIRMKSALLNHAKQIFPNVNSYTVRLDLSLDWKLLGTLLFTYHARMTDVLRKNLGCSIAMNADDACTVTVGFAEFDDLLWLDGEEDWFAARNTYYYLNTVYDDNGRERKPSGYVMPTEKLDAMAFPLDEIWYKRIKTTWFRSRDGGKRMHTGMDIRCSLGSPVYACAGGTVNSVGYHVKGGYYVSVVDTDGFEYFYYHLKKDSQCVVRGQKVMTGERLGLSGNTGNSAAPHLHLSVITPDHRFIDPFHIYYRWVYRKTGMLVKKPS